MIGGREPEAGGAFDVVALAGGGIGQRARLKLRARRGAPARSAARRAAPYRRRADLLRMSSCVSGNE